MKQPPENAKGQKAKKRRGPGGKARSQAQIHQRRQVLEELLAEGLSRDEVLERASYLCDGVSASTLAADIKLIVQRWAEVDAASLPERRGAALSRLRDHVKRAREQGAWSGVAALERILRQIEGTLPVGAGVSVNVGLQVNAGATAEDSFERALEGLDERERAECLAAVDAVRRWKALGLSRVRNGGGGGGNVAGGGGPAGLLPAGGEGK